MSSSDIESGRELGGVIGGASHDVYSDPELRDRIIVRGAIGYRKRGAYGGWKIKRAVRKDGKPDDYKFTMPIFDNLSSFDIQTYSLLRAGIPIMSNVTTRETLPKIEAIRDFTGASKDRLVFVEEPRKKSIFRTHKVGLIPLSEKLPPTARIAFVPLDLPFAYDYRDMWTREDPFDGMHMDCNARESIFPEAENELFERNYYFHVNNVRSFFERFFRWRDEKVHSKEGHKVEFNLKRLEDSLKKIEEGESGQELIYDNREGGVVFSGSFAMDLARLVPSRILTHPYLTMKFLLRGAPSLTRYLALHTVYKGASISINGLESTLGFALGMPTRLMFENTDPAFLRDVDDRKDRDWYHKIFRAAVGRYGSVEEAFNQLFPFGKELSELNNVMGEVNQDIDMVGNFPDYENQRRGEIQTILDSYGRETYGLELKPAFNSEGNFILEDTVEDNIDASLDFFVRKSTQYRLAA